MHVRARRRTKESNLACDSYNHPAPTPQPNPPPLVYSSLLTSKCIFCAGLASPPPAPPMLKVRGNAGRGGFGGWGGFIVENRRNTFCRAANVRRIHHRHNERGRIIHLKQRSVGVGVGVGVAGARGLMAEPGRRQGRVRWVGEMGGRCLGLSRITATFSPTHQSAQGAR